MPVMSDRLRAMIDTYKQKTKEFGAPNKKIRLPPSLVDLCIRYGFKSYCSMKTIILSATRNKLFHVEFIMKKKNL